MKTGSLLLKRSEVYMKKKMFMIFLLLAAWLPAEVIQNENISLREGAGAFFPVLAVLQKGENVKILADDSYWAKVETAAKLTGYVPKTAFEAAENRINFDLIAGEIADLQVDKLIVSAAVKGFFETKMGGKGLNQELAQKPFRRYVNGWEYNQFKAATFTKGRWTHQKFLRKNRLDYAKKYQLDENMIAVSIYIAARLAAPGLETNINKIRYVNHVAQLVVESSEYYDLPVTVYIVKSNEIFANATPAGLIVISNGMLKQIQSEHELACLLGHELAHITLGHGIQESQRRKPNVRAASGFDMADKEFDAFESEMGYEQDEKWKEAEAELEAVAAELYERAIKGHSDRYEAEADIRGVEYAMRAGYDPRGMVEMMHRLGKFATRDTDDTKATHWFPYSFTKRIKGMEKYYAEELRRNMKHYEQFSSRYQQSAW
jgi:hypothetical protein